MLHLSLRETTIIFFFVMITFCDSHHFTSSAAHVCLANEYMVFLGDSSMTERAQDIALIYSGANSNATLVEEFIESPVHGNCRTPPPMPSNFSLAKDFILSFFNNQRNFTMGSSSTQFTAHFRFTGHYLPIENHLGIRTWLHPHFSNELRTTMGLDGTSTRLPSTLVLNSAHHDASNKANSFDPAFFQRSLVTFLARIYQDFTSRNATLEIYWLGTLISPRLPVASTLHMIEKIAKTVITSMPTGHYVDTSEVLPSYANSTEMITVDNMHFGINARVHDRAVTGNASVAATELLLQEICCRRSAFVQQMPALCNASNNNSNMKSNEGSVGTASSNRKSSSVSDIAELSRLLAFRGFARNCSNRLETAVETSGVRSDPLVFLDAGWIRPFGSPEVRHTLSVGPFTQLYVPSLVPSAPSSSSLSTINASGNNSNNNGSSSVPGGTTTSNGNNESNGNSGGCIVKRLWDLLPVGPAVSPWLVNDTLIRPASEKSVYIVKEGYRRRVASAQTLMKYGWTFDDVKVIPDHDAILLPFGPTFA